MDLTVDEDGYTSSTGSVDEDAELELSCALHDLALRVKSFEENMQGRFKHDLDDDEEEITEDFDHIEEESIERHYGRQRMDSDSASPKCKSSRRRRSNEFKAKPQHEDEDEYYPLDSDDQDQPETKGREEKEDWDSQEEKEELCELKQNIAKLLAGMQKEAKRSMRTRQTVKLQVKPTVMEGGT
ncbi:hypothetical protein P3T76_005750 [Phytophthora citrophthora]|uniref:Uncharacterized protein n=1 Tax=Phytophthora citrophthora TaxID=4793 RepID=A0AAD9GRW7_9STRA|nr:hypothetical protein P3T76_005750 [Phytophthora citrophthora]